MISMPKVQDIRKMARAGCSVAEISRETGVSEPTVRISQGRSIHRKKLNPDFGAIANNT